MKIEYVANDGTRFDNEEQCKKYESKGEMDKIAEFRYFEVFYKLDEKNHQDYYRFFVVMSDEFCYETSIEILRCFLNWVIFDNNITLAEDDKTIIPMYKINKSNLRDYMKFCDERPDAINFFLTSQDKDYQLLPDKYNISKLL